MKKGFDRLKGVAAASVMGIGMIGAGSGRAASLPSNSRSLGFSIRTTLAATISNINLNATVVGIGGNNSSDTFDIGAFRVVNTAGTLYNKIATSYTTSYVSVSGSWVTSDTYWVPTTNVTGPGASTCPNGTLPSSPTSPPTSSACWLTTGSASLTNGYYSSITSSSLYVSQFSTGSSRVWGSAYDDAFDGVLGMSVGGAVFKNPDNTIDFTDDVVSSDVVNNIVAGIDAQIQYTFAADRGDTSVGAVRAMYTLTNTTGAEIITTANIFGNLGSDEYTTIQASASGDAVADGADQWTVSSETQVGNETLIGWSPAMIVTRYGTGAAIVPAQTSVLGERGNTPNVDANVGNDAFANDYALTIPAGETQRILVFIEAHKTNAGAETAGADFETLAAANKEALLAGLTATECSEIVNYDVTGTDCDNIRTTPYVPASSDSGAFNPLTLFSVVGLAGLLRRFRKDK